MVRLLGIEAVRVIHGHTLVSASEPTSLVSLLGFSHQLGLIFQYVQPGSTPLLLPPPLLLPLYSPCHFLVVSPAGCGFLRAVG